MIYLLHGEEEFLRAEALLRLKAELGDPEMAGLNTVWLDGRKVSLADVQMACDAPPFLAERRLVVVEGFLARLLGRRREAAGAEEDEGETGPAGPTLRALSDYLEQVPPTTALVLWEPQEISPAHPIYKTLMRLAQEGRAQVIPCQPIKKEEELADWIMARARVKGARLTYDAAQELATYVGSQLRLLDQELDKLSVYAAGRPITPADVRLLVSATREANVFQMVDALGAGGGRQAVQILRDLLEDGQPPLAILGMLARQVRLLLFTKDLLARGLSSAEIARELHLQGWQADRLVRQANRYTFPQLERMHDRLLEADIAIKTGQMEDDVALEMLVVGWSR
jgi:DNA polymerase-3 subunit delta